MIRVDEQRVDSIAKLYEGMAEQRIGQNDPAISEEKVKSSALIHEYYAKGMRRVLEMGEPID